MSFPYFTTIHGDLHPHFMVLIVAIVLIALLLDFRKERDPDSPRQPSPYWQLPAIAFFLRRRL